VSISTLHPEATVPQPVRTKCRIRRPTRYQINLLVEDCIAAYALLGFLGTVTTIDADGAPLKYNRAIQGPDREHWLMGHFTEFHRLIDLTQTMLSCELTRFHTVAKPHTTIHRYDSKSKR
jgi:hypothetical protein